VWIGITTSDFLKLAQYLNFSASVNEERHQEWIWLKIKVDDSLCGTSGSCYAYEAVRATAAGGADGS